jgi:23S rRNA pseudouridine2605 synthase
MRVHRALAQAGVASRRAAEQLVADGRVTVNGALATIGQSVEDSDDLAVDGVAVTRETTEIYLLHKPIGTVSTASDPEGRPTVLDGLPTHVRLYPVGRLDLQTTGALLITNDGELAHRLMHPRYRVPKIYEARVTGRVSAEGVRQLRHGVDLEDGRTNPATVEKMDRLHPKATWLRVEITEGRNRQVRRMCEAIGHPVESLHRVRYAGLGLGKLAPGEYRSLTSNELTRLGKLVGLQR